ncbi:hypothetical protein [Burkholderia pseudomallei]|uniref:hypothetical protein n=1 Tax=Burkholderia pseudomallei TaxID=28450 RepID=UPI000F0456BA|nr:hypothetical protein [Burkholderia pseudomallei]VBG63448.1 Uncharacterised protein [Burkholderia pseudomallei]
MNDSPICPWCRGPVLRSARRCWVCIPCATLLENAKRTGEPLPWANTPFFENLVTDEPTPPGVCPRYDDELAPYEGWYDGLIRHHWGLRRIAARRDLRYLKEEAASKARRDEQALRAMADGPEAFRKRLDRPPRIELTADKLVNRRSSQEHWFALVAAGEVRTDIAAVLAESPAFESDQAYLLVGVGDDKLQRGETVDPDELERYIDTVLSRTPEKVLNEMGWATYCSDDMGNPTDADLWVVVFHRLPTALPDRTCKAVFDRLIGAGARPSISVASRSCRSELEHVPNAWKDHLAHLLLDFTKQHLRHRIDAGDDLVALTKENHYHRGVLGVLERAGLDLAAVPDEVLSHAIRFEPAIAERIVMARVAAGASFSGGKPEHCWPPLYDAVSWHGGARNRWGPWRPDEQARQLAELALYRRIIDRLIDAGADVNFGDDRDRDGALTYNSHANPLLTAIEREDMGMVHHLLRRGARVEVALDVLREKAPTRHSIDPRTHQRRIATLVAIQVALQQAELRAVAEQVTTTEPEEAPAAPVRCARRRL